MKRALLLFLLAALSMASGYLMSESTWVGKVGISLFHKGYNLTKIWWQGAIAVFIIYLLFFFLHLFLHNKLPVIAAKILHFLFLLAAVAGLYFTYDDFQNDFSHRLLGHHFHFGFYLVWVGWMMVCLFFLFSKRKKKDAILVQGKKEPVTQ